MHYCFIVLRFRSSVCFRPRLLITHISLIYKWSTIFIANASKNYSIFWFQNPPNPSLGEMELYIPWHFLSSLDICKQHGCKRHYIDRTCGFYCFYNSLISLASQIFFTANCNVTFKHCTAVPSYKILWRWHLHTTEKRVKFSQILYCY